MNFLKKKLFETTTKKIIKNNPYNLHKNIKTEFNIKKTTNSLINKNLAEIKNNYFKILKNDDFKKYVLNQLKISIINRLIKNKIIIFNKTFEKSLKNMSLNLHQRLYKKWYKHLIIYNNKLGKFIKINKKKRIQSWNKLKQYKLNIYKNSTLSYKSRFIEKKLRYYMAIAYVLATDNNTLITIQNYKKIVFQWMTTGRHGYKNSHKSSPFASENTAKALGKNIKYNHGINNIIVKIKGFGIGRRSTLKGFKLAKLAIFKLEDKSYLAHNGCRKKKKRRL